MEKIVFLLPLLHTKHIIKYIWIAALNVKGKNNKVVEESIE